MENNYLAPLIVTVLYLTLLLITLFTRPKQRQQKLFAVYLSAAALWSLSDFLLRSAFLMDYKLLLFRFVLFFSLAWVVQLYFFTRSFLDLPAGLGVRLGYGALGLFTVFLITGYAPPEVAFSGGHVEPAYGWWFAFYIIPIVLIAVFGVYSLARRYKSQLGMEEHNKTGYLILAICALMAFGFVGVTPLAREVPVSHFGGLVSACVLTYAVVKHDLVSISLVLRRGLGITILAVVGFLGSLLLFYLIHLIVGFELDAVTLILAAIAVLLIVWLISRLHPIFLGTIDRLFYRDRYAYRRELVDFIRHKISGVFSLQELGEGLLPPLVKALDCQAAYILLQEASGDFVTAFSEPHSEENRPHLHIKQGSPIIDWLKREYCTREDIDVLPEFRSLWDEERNIIRKLGIELLFPLVSRESLIGVLAICRKYSGKYTVEDSNLVDSITNQIAISLEKTYYQEELKKREQELSLINRLSNVMTSSLNIQDVYDAFVSGLGEVVHIDFAAVAMIDRNELFFSAISASPEIGQVWQINKRMYLEGTATEWVINNNRSIYEPDLSHDTMFANSRKYLDNGIRSILYLPLVSKGEGIGSLIIGSRNPDEYTPAQTMLLERLAKQISTSVANAQLYAKAEQRARIDDLTGLYNRRHFDEILVHEIDRHARYGSELSLIFIDLDSFKSYNDSMGHITGDKLLAKIGNSLFSAIRNIDVAFRYGGDEFAILMPQTNVEDGFAAAERIRNLIANESAHQQLSVTLSLGLASWPGDGLTADHIVNAADKALYHAKRTGGNRTCMVSHMLPLSTELQEKTPAAEKEVLSIIYALASTIEARDPYTYGHSRKVRYFAVALAESMGLPPDRVAVVSHAALLHDIGKIGIYDEVLNKAGKLNIEERELIKTHPELSRTIVGHVPGLTPCLPAIHQHHERWDGKGYPNGLKGEAISLEGRILAIADAYDAMTSNRPYRNALSVQEAVDELEHNAGLQFDPALVKSFVPIALATSLEQVRA